MKKWLVRIVKWGLVALLFTYALIYFGNRAVILRSQKYLYGDLKEVPKQKVGLLLGTSKYVSNGNINQFYAYRIQAAVDLYRAGKVSFILVSGDNGTTSYNEPRTIKRDLIARGIPAEKIILDYAGFRTYDSVVRANKVFGQNGFIVISQEFHNQRVVYIARKRGIEAYGYNAKSVGSRYGFKTMQREKLAKVKAILDLMVNKSPKFLGDKIVIE